MDVTSSTYTNSNANFRIRKESLELRPVGRRDAGLYTCTAQNSVGTSEPQSVQLDVKCMYFIMIYIEIGHKWVHVRLDRICIRQSFRHLSISYGFLNEKYYFGFNSKETKHIFLVKPHLKMSYRDWVCACIHFLSFYITITVCLSPSLQTTTHS